MKPEKKISLLFLCVAMLIIAGCRKDDTPAEVKTPVGFRAMSQVVVSKDSDGTSNKLPDTVEKFGVWGVAGNDLNIQYLWNSSTLTDVNRQSDGTTYVPSSDGYWFSNSTHDFLALASDPSTVALPSVSISHTANSNQLNPSMTFTYDLSARYTAKDYDFDFLGAAARNVVERSIPASQDLIFWHLFSRIIITVEFVGATGQINQMRLFNIDSVADYTLSMGSDKTISVACTSNSETSQSNVSFIGLAQGGNVLHILPQNISDFRLFLDFTITKDGQNVPVNNFEVNLSKAKESPNYGDNDSYKWVIKISPKDVAFDIAISPWVDAEGEFEFDLQ